MTIDVLTAGAKGDGTTKDTAAVQKAIDECSAQGGGKVVFPAGKYLLGKVNLKSYITVVLENGCEIIASPDKEDYPPSQGREGSQLVAGEDGLFPRQSVFFGCGLESVTICGEGVINGNYKAFLKYAPGKHGHLWMDYADDYEIYARDGFRCLLVYIEASNNVILENIRLVDASCYTVHMRDCHFVKIHGVHINNYLGANNSDGLHLCSCTDVRISDCDLICGDDAIAIDSNDGKSAERFAISNCIITSRNNCFRIFTGLLTPGEGSSEHPYGLVRDIVISGCVARRADAFVSINADRGEICNVQMIGIGGTIKGAGTAFVMSSHNGSYIHRIKLSQWNVTAHGAGYICADKKTNSRIEDVSFTDVDILVEPVEKMYGCGMGEMPRLPDGGELPGVPMYWTYHIMPWFMEIINAKDISLDKVKIAWGSERLEGMATMESEDGKKLIETISGQWKWPAPKPFTKDFPAVLATNTENLQLYRTDLQPHGNCSEIITE